MKRFLQTLFFFLSAVYPFIIYWGQQHVSPLVMSLFILAIIILRASTFGVPNRSGLLWLLSGGILVFLTYLSDQYDPLYWYPALANLVLLFIFGYSLYSPPTVIERIARLQDPNLPFYAIEYTRKVTIAWCLFFIINGVLAAATTLYGDQVIWTIYNGIIAYSLIATLFVIEWLYRQHYRKKHADT